MQDLVELSGVVLLTQPVGEYDKRLVILTRERGKITAFAHGARRAKSPLIAVSNAFVFAVFSLREGREAYTLVSAEAADYFEGLAVCLPGAWYGFYFLELAGYYGREGIPAGEMVNLVYVALKALMKDVMPTELIRRVYEERMMVINGEFAVPSADRRNFAPAAFKALDYAASAPYGRLFSFVLEGEALRDYTEYVRRAVKRTVDRSFKSLDVIEKMV